MGTARRKAHRTAEDRILLAVTVIAWLLYLLSSLLLSWSIYHILVNDHMVRQSAKDAVHETSGWPMVKRTEMFQASLEYNNRLEQRFGSSIPADMRNEDGQPLELLDSEYINMGGNTIATLNIPSISVTVPIYHTTLDTVLDKGAGHMYGTALPAGQEGTSSVIAAHSGGVQGLLFSRLVELRQGAYFYVNIYGTTHAYQVDATTTVLPDQVEQALQEEKAKARTATSVTAKKTDDPSDMRTQIPAPDKSGTARVSMVTCTPIGVNTHRLIISGHRVGTPSPAPAADSVKDTRLQALIWALVVLVIAITAAVIFHIIRKHSNIKTAKGRHHA